MLTSVSALVVLGAGAADAGPNAGGTLVIHQAESTCYSPAGSLDCCGADDVPTRCSEVEARYDGSNPTVWHVFAAFPAGSSPRMAGVAFGIEYDEAALVLLRHEDCGAYFELPSADWPDPGSGTVLSYEGEETSLFREIYSFAGYATTESPTEFALVPQPDIGGVFADPSVPSVLDPIADYGRLGFHTFGYVPCPHSVFVGACCFPGSCLDMTELACADANGVYLGPGTHCDAQSCPERIDGACCVDRGVCLVRDPYECAREAGTYQGEGTICRPETCAGSPTLEGSWGAIKQRFRDVR
ncbi:MAG: hypothetical protein R3E12_10980 [Candidatus Eisenbacteria bacterium]